VRHAAERDNSRAQIVALEQNVDELKSTETELGTLQSLAEQRQKDNENLVRHIDTLTVERAQLMAQVSALEAQVAKAPATAVASAPAESSRAVFAQGDDLVDRVERLDRRVIELESERNSLRNREEILEAQLKEASDLRDGTLARFQDVVSQLNAIRSERDRLARANVSLESDLRAAQSQRTLVKSETAPPAQEGGLLSRIISLGSDDSSGSSREVDRTIASYEIIGVTASEAGDKAILNGRVYHGGDVVDVNLGIVFKRIDGDALVFIDDQGREYRRRF
jgi:DNA repair exonuclease SbcCD ATPase subunit